MASAAYGFAQVGVKLLTLRSNGHKPCVPNPPSCELPQIPPTPCDRLKSRRTNCALRLKIHRPCRISSPARRRWLSFAPLGAVAQLGERRTGSAEVRGSIPLGSTRKSVRFSIHWMQKPLRPSETPCQGQFGAVLARAELAPFQSFGDNARGRPPLSGQPVLLPTGH